MDGDTDQTFPEPRAARDVKTGESWAFPEHRTMATADLGLLPLTNAAALAARVLRRLALAIERGTSPQSSWGCERFAWQQLLLDSPLAPA